MPRTTLALLFIVLAMGFNNTWANSIEIKDRHRYHLRYDFISKGPKEVLIKYRNMAKANPKSYELELTDRGYQLFYQKWEGIKKVLT